MSEQPLTDRLQYYLEQLRHLDEAPRVGKVRRLVGLTVESLGPQAEVGQLVEIRPPKRGPLLAEVVGFDGDTVLLMPYDEVRGVSPGVPVVSVGRDLQIPVGPELLGRVLDGLGRPLDGREPPGCIERCPVQRRAPHPLARRPISEPLCLGVRSIDGLMTCGKGQRLGVFAGSGVGKSTLLGMMARAGAADVNVIALIGERGREVREFLERDLGEEGLAKSVVVVATSDEPAMVRLKGAFVATAIAEYFRDQGQDVLFMMDSVTRFALAQREVGLAAGEPPATKGYTPSVFALLPRLLERVGSSDGGTITGLYTVLVEGDDMSDPIADTVRGILDGHVVLSRKLAERSHFPAVDVSASISRSMVHLVSPEHQQAALHVREWLAAYRDAEDLINIGAYVKGNNPRIDRSIERIDAINAFLRQSLHDRPDFQATVSALTSLAS